MQTFLIRGKTGVDKKTILTHSITKINTQECKIWQFYIIFIIYRLKIFPLTIDLASHLEPGDVNRVPEYCIHNNISYYVNKNVCLLKLCKISIYIKLNVVRMLNPTHSICQNRSTF